MVTGRRVCTSQLLFAKTGTPDMTQLFLLQEIVLRYDDVFVEIGQAVPLDEASSIHENAG